MKSSVILQPQTTATHRLQRKRYIVIKMQGKYFIHFLQKFKNLKKYVHSTYLVAVVVCFLICWGPYHIQRLSYIFFSMTSSWNSNILSFYQRAHFISGKKIIPFLKSTCLVFKKYVCLCSA